LVKHFQNGEAVCTATNKSGGKIPDYHYTQIFYAARGRDIKISEQNISEKGSTLEMLINQLNQAQLKQLALTPKEIKRQEHNDIVSRHLTETLEESRTLTSTSSTAVTSTSSTAVTSTVSSMFKL
jgi:hypothetical protein